MYIIISLYVLQVYSNTLRRLTHSTAHTHTPYTCLHVKVYHNNIYYHTTRNTINYNTYFYRFVMSLLGLLKQWTQSSTLQCYFRSTINTILIRSNYTIRLFSFATGNRYTTVYSANFTPLQWLINNNNISAEYLRILSRVLGFAYFSSVKKHNEIRARSQSKFIRARYPICIFLKTTQVYCYNDIFTFINPYCSCVSLV